MASASKAFPFTPIGIPGLSAPKCGYPMRFARQALGHNSKAVHHAYARNVEVIVPSLADWEDHWQKHQSAIQPPAPRLPKPLEAPQLPAANQQGAA